MSILGTAGDNLKYAKDSGQKQTKAGIKNNDI